MKTLYKKAGLAIALGATSLAAAAPAQAQRYGYHGGYHRGYYHGGHGGDAAIAGIAGLAIGAALASNHDRRRDVYYRDRGFRPDYDGYYYRQHGYYPINGYYAYNYRGRYPHCYVQRRWDGFARRSVLVRVCR